MLAYTERKLEELKTLCKQSGLTFYLSGQAQCNVNGRIYVLNARGINKAIQQVHQDLDELSTTAPMD